MALQKAKGTGDDAGVNEESKSSPASTTSTVMSNVDNTRTTRDMTADASRMEVLATNELLEEILLKLPIRNLFAVQRVCRIFRDTVQSSPRIQQHLFLRSVEVELQSWVIHRTFQGWEEKHTWIPIVESKFIHTKVDKKAIPKRYLRSPIRLCPLLHHDNDPQQGFTGSRSANSAERTYRYHEVITFDLKGIDLREPGSWRHTFLSKPPCTSACIRMEWSIDSTPAASGYIEREVRDVNGFTLGGLIDAAIAAEGCIIRYPSGDPSSVLYGATFNEVLRDLEENSGKKARFEAGGAKISLCGFVIPSAEEWSEMKELRNTGSVERWSEAELEEMVSTYERAVS